LDVSALLCGADAMVFYNQPVGAGGAVRCLGREQPSPTSSTDSIALDLPRMPAEIAKVVIAVSLDGSAPPHSPPSTGSGSPSPPNPTPSPSSRSLA
jgi:stress response protein SCP2